MHQLHTRLHIRLDKKTAQQIKPGFISTGWLGLAATQGCLFACDMRWNALICHRTLQVMAETRGSFSVERSEIQVDSVLVHLERCQLYRVVQMRHDRVEPSKHYKSWPEYLIHSVSLPYVVQSCTGCVSLGTT